MTQALLQLIIAAVVIIVAGTLLARFTNRIAEETGLGGLLVGSLFLAAATSLPEIMVNFNAVALGLPDLAVGDLLGSNLFNLLILMGVSACFYLPEKTGLYSRQHATAATFSIALTTLAALGMVANLEFAFLRAGLFSWVILLCYLVGLRLLSISGTQHAVHVQEKRKQRITIAISGYVACAVVLLLAAPYLAEGADYFATATGLGHSFVGTTLVAFTTSLPELVATIAAFRMRCPDLALGNIFGSNMFNMAMFLPLDWYYEGNFLRAAESLNGITALGVIFATSIATVVLLLGPVTRKAVLTGNALVITSVVAVLWLLYYLKIE